MKLQAFLCDAASVRDNLLFVIGGAITRIWRPQVPAPLGVDLALLLTIHPTEAEDLHQLRIRIATADGAPIANVDAEFGLQPAPPGPHARRPGENFLFPLAVPLREIVVPGYGDYGIDLMVDQHHAESLFFRVSPPATPSEDEARPNGDTPADDESAE